MFFALCWKHFRALMICWRTICFRYWLDVVTCAKGMRNIITMRSMARVVNSVHKKEKTRRMSYHLSWRIIITRIRDTTMTPLTYGLCTTKPPLYITTKLSSVCHVRLISLNYARIPAQSVVVLYPLEKSKIIWVTSYSILTSCSFRKLCEYNSKLRCEM